MPTSRLLLQGDSKLTEFSRQSPYRLLNDPDNLIRIPLIRIHKKITCSPTANQIISRQSIKDLQGARLLVMILIMKGLQFCTSFGNTFSPSHRKLTANQRPFCVNPAKQGISAEGWTPAIFQSHHAHGTVSIRLNKMPGYAGISQYHRFQTTATGFAVRAGYLSFMCGTIVVCHLSPFISILLTIVISLLFTDSSTI